MVGDRSTHCTLSLPVAAAPRKLAWASALQALVLGGALTGGMGAHLACHMCEAVPGGEGYSSLSLGTQLWGGLPALPACSGVADVASRRPRSRSIIVVVVASGLRVSGTLRC